MSASRIQSLHTGSFFKPEREEVLKKRKPLNRMSPKRQKESRIYARLRKQFLEANPICQMRVQCEHSRATECHHSKGRGKYYLDVSSWIAACFYCHAAVHANPNQARKAGLLA